MMQSPKPPSPHTRVLKRLTALAGLVILALLPTRSNSQRGPITLPAVLAEAIQTVCPNEDQSRARALWAVLSSRYSGPADDATLAAEVRFQYGTVSEHQVGDWSRLPNGSGHQWMAGSRRKELLDRIVVHGYAVPHSGASSQFEAWEYAPLHSDLATHFIRDVFLQRNTLSVIREDDTGEIILGFCPRRQFRRQPVVEGRLILRADTTLAEAQWRFHTPRANENAGGIVIFRPYDSAQLLLAERGVLFYRKSLFYHHQMEAYHNWRIGRSPYETER